MARATLRRTTATRAELAATREVLAAAPRVNLTIEVVRTRMKDGQSRTFVEQVVHSRDEVTAARLAAAVGVALEIYSRIERATAIEIDFGTGRITQARNRLLANNPLYFPQAPW